LRLRNIFDLPGTAYGGYDCGSHTFPPRATRCECLWGTMQNWGARIAERMSEQKILRPEDVLTHWLVHAGVLRAVLGAGLTLRAVV